MSGSSLVSLIWFSAVAPASEPTMDKDGSVCVRVVLPASETEVRAHLDSAAEASSLVGEAKIVNREAVGNCERLTYSTPGMISSLTYVSMRCPTENGWKETLVSSDSFADNESEWQLREVDGGTELNYRVRIRLNLPVGQKIVDSRIAQSMKRAVERLEERLSKMF